MKVRFSFLTAGMLLIGAPLGLLCFNKVSGELGPGCFTGKQTVEGI